jgi:hypothetical protein
MQILAAALALGLWVPDAELEKAKSDLKRAVAEVNASGVREAAGRIAASDQKAGVDALLDGYGACAGLIKALWGEKMAAITLKEANAHFRVNTATNPPTIVQGDEKIYLKYQEAEKASQAVEAKIMRIEECKRGIVKALGRFKGDASIKELLRELKGNSAWEKRAGVAEALGEMSSPEIAPALAEAIRKDGEPQVRVAAMDAAREAKASTPEVLGALVEALKHEYWQVKSTAALTLKALGAKDAIEPLIEALGKNEGRLRQDFNDALVALTGVNKNADPNAWKSWWEGSREAVKAGTFKPVPSDAAGDKPAGGTTFYGIPVTSKNVIFILDRSGSMMEPSEWKIPNDVATGGSGKDPAADIKKTGDRKIDVARWQLKRTLAMMPDGIEFNLIFYSHEWTILSEKMLKLSAGTRKQAYEFIDRLDPFGPTNIYDPLEKGLAYSSAGAMAEKLARSGIDTIYFLTDGMPNSGQVPNAPDILVKIKEVNKTKKVKIHTIGVFSSDKTANPLQPGEAQQGGAFLKQLAEENGGLYYNAGSPQSDPAKDALKKR